MRVACRLIFKISFHSDVNKTHFYMKSFAIGLALKMTPINTEMVYYGNPWTEFPGISVPTCKIDFKKDYF